MSKWITIKTFTLPTDAAVLRTRLESEGIECFVTNEITAQVNLFLSNAVGGVQLQVKEEDWNDAMAILKEGGYYIEEDTKPSKAWIKIDRITSKIPLLNKASLLLRLLIIIGLIVGILVSILVFTTLPSAANRFTPANWCLDNVSYNNKIYAPQTYYELRFLADGESAESITFCKDGTARLPGFKTPLVFALWKLENDFHIITNSDLFDYIYNGMYQFAFVNDKLILKSVKTTMKCHTDKYHSNFPF